MTLLELIYEKLEGTAIVLTKIPFTGGDGFAYSTRPNKKFETVTGIIDNVYQDRWEPDSDWTLIVMLDDGGEMVTVFVGLNEEVLLP